jgi:hypothetical protein
MRLHGGDQRLQRRRQLLAVAVQRGPQRGPAVHDAQLRATRPGRGRRGLRTVFTGTCEQNTVLAASPTTEEEPFLYQDASGNYKVLVPSVQHNTTGTSWASGTEAGTSIPLSRFFVASPATPVHEINLAFESPDTPGVQFHNVFGVWIGGSGGLDSVVNGVGGPVTSTDPGTVKPVDVTSYP